MTSEEIDQQFVEESQRVWRFLSEMVIFREDGKNLNKHQKFIKEKA